MYCTSRANYVAQIREQSHFFFLTTLSSVINTNNIAINYYLLADTRRLLVFTVVNVAARCSFDGDD